MADYFNSNIKFLRSVKNISQQYLADKIGVDRSTISRIENGEIDTTLENALKIADVLNVKIEDLIAYDFKSDTEFLEKMDVDNLEVLVKKANKHLSDSDKEVIKFIVNKTINEYEKNNAVPNSK